MTVAQVATAAADASGCRDVGSTLSVVVTFSDSVTVYGFPSLLLAVSATGGSASYASGNGTSSLTFSYTVLAGDSAWGLAYSSTSALSLSAGSGSEVVDSLGNAATVSLPAVGSASALGASNRLSIPCVSVASVRPASGFERGCFNAGSVVRVTVEWSSAVYVHGDTTQLGLSLDVVSGGGSASAVYLSGNGTTTLTFELSVLGSYWARVLSYSSSGALSVSGGGASVVDQLGNAVSLSLPAPGSALSLQSSNWLSIREWMLDAGCDIVGDVALWHCGCGILDDVDC